MCVNLTPISECVEYSNTYNPATSTYQCTKCADGYFLKHNMCKQREENTENCETFRSTEDYCIKCVDGYYLTNEKLCESYPTGIVNCIHYSK